MNPLSKHNYEIELSMMEIYNEEVIDLLPSNSTTSSTKVSSRQHQGSKLEVISSSSSSSGGSSGGGGQSRVIVRGLTSCRIHNAAQAKKLFDQGMNNRAVASTDVHAHSSRSHCIVRIDVRGIPKSSSGEEGKEGKEERKEKKEHNYQNNETLGRLYLVDLAGSERVNKSGVKGKQLVEAKNINRSLSALGDVIEALDKKRNHIPYRNSTLTRLLQDALCTNSVVAVIVTVCPSESTADESISSLYFAQRLRNIEMGVAQKKITMKNNQDDNQVLQNKIHKLQLFRKKAIAELENLRATAKSNRDAMARKQDQSDRTSRSFQNDLSGQLNVAVEKSNALEKRCVEMKNRHGKCEPII